MRRTNKGIGLGLTKEFLRQGYRVIAVMCEQNESELRAQLASEFQNKLHIEHCDVTAASEVPMPRPGGGLLNAC